MASKSGEILTDKGLDNISQDSDVIENDIHIYKLLAESPSSENSTLTQIVDLEEEVLDSGCCTPREFIFDPFAAAPEEFCVAPMRKKAATSPPIHTIDFKEEVLDSGCSTPPELIFDPFAAGPDKLCLAPKRKKAILNPPRRQLRPGFDLSPSFDLDSEFEDFEEEEIQKICKSFLDLIISDALKICEVKMLLGEGGEGKGEEGKGEGKGEEEEGDGFRTPTEMTSITAIADTCPGAPMRPSLKIPTDLKCVMPRKLNFDLDLD